MSLFNSRTILIDSLKKASFLLLVSYLSASALDAPNLSKLEQPIQEEEQHNFRADVEQNLMLEVTADEISYNQNTDFYEAIGKAEAYLPDKGATLYADRITYDAKQKLVEAFGSVEMIQGEGENRTVVQGTYTSFHTDTNILDLSKPRVFLKGLRLKARTAHGKLAEKEQHKEIRFEDGVLALDQPMNLYLRGFRVGTRYSQDSVREDKNAEISWSDLPEKSSFRYSAEEIVYDDTKRINNLNIKGARIWINDHFSIPSPVNINTTVGEAAETRFNGPVFGTQERIGGFAMGPRFFYAPKDIGIFSLAPLLQIGDGPEFGFGLIGTYSRPSSGSSIMGGYGTLDDRWILNLHQKLPYGFEINILKNQFVHNTMFGATLVGEFAELGHTAKLEFPLLLDQRGIRIYNSVAIAKDNASLFSARRLEDLREQRSEAGSVSGDKDLRDFRSEHSINFYSRPVFRYGNEIYNISLSARGQGAFRFYGTGDHLAIARYGPALEARLDRLSFELDYLFASINGESPFLFDQFIDGSQSVVFDGDYQFSKWFSVGTYLTFNMDSERFARNQVRAIFGPEDFKLTLSFDTILNQLGLGFNMIMGDPLSFERLDVKTR